MSKKLFVGGLAWATTEEKLSEVFSPYGEVTECKVVKDRETGRSRGFGFVSFSDEASAQRAAEEMQGKEVDGRSIRVDMADDTPRGGSRGGGSGDRRPRTGGGGRPSSNYGGRDSQGRGGDFSYPSDDGGHRGDSRRGNKRGGGKSRDRYDDDRWS